MTPDEFARAIERESDRIEAGLTEILQDYAAGATGRIKAQAPVATGGYRASIHVASIDGGASIRTDHPAANVLEFGAFGTEDGKPVRTREPRPHWRPAFSRLRSEVGAEVKKLLK